MHSLLQTCILEGYHFVQKWHLKPFVECPPGGKQTQYFPYHYFYHTGNNFCHNSCQYPSSEVVGEVVWSVIYTVIYLFPDCPTIPISSIGIIRILLENPESRPICDLDRKNPDFDWCCDIFVIFS